VKLVLSSQVIDNVSDNGNWSLSPRNEGILAKSGQGVSPGLYKMGGEDVKEWTRFKRHVSRMNWCQKWIFLG
jgi:hypothetical protein